MNYLIAGGAGFIGSHVAKRLFHEEPEAELYIYDNFSSGREEHLGEIGGSTRVHIIKGDFTAGYRFLGRDVPDQ